jgi:gas vesicle protein
MFRSSEFTRHRTGDRERYETDERPESADDRQGGYRTREQMIGYDEEERRGWDKLGVFGAGLAIGAALGAATALLLAPHSGEDTRELLGDQARHLGDRASDSWEDLRDELRWLARRGRTSVRRGMTRGRWKAQDAVARGRRRLG